MSLSDIVNITISKTTANISRAGFGKALILGKTAHFHRIEWIGQSDYATELTALGISSSNVLYGAVVDHFAQNPAPTMVAVGQRKCAQVTVTVDSVVNLTDYTIKIATDANRTYRTYTYTSDGTATQTEIADALALAITNGETEVGATNVADDVQIDTVGAAGFAAQRPIGQSTLLTVGAAAGAIEDSDDSLDAILLIDDDWYGLCCADDRAVGDKADQILIMAWAETNRKLFIAATSDPAMLTSPDSTSISSTCNTNSYAYSAVMYHSLAATEYIDAAWLGKCLPQDPGSQTWAFKTLASITVDALATTPRTVITSTDGNFYVTEADVATTYWGTTGADYIDITRFIDWLRIRMQEDLVALLIAQLKVPFTDAGIAMVEGKIQKRLEEGVRIGGLAPLDLDAVSVPLAADVSTANKTARTLTAVTFKADLAGAIHEVTVTGTVSI
jgi:hypothetical protein